MRRNGNYVTMGEVVEHLDGINPRRIRLKPEPGTATEKDLLRILDHENRPCELVDGILVEKPMGFNESMVAGEIITEMNLFLRVHDLGVVGGEAGTLKLLRGLVRIPDASFISWTQLPERLGPRKKIPELYPDLAVEVLSEGNTKGEMQRKLKEYFLAGTRLVWFVDPEARTVEVFTAPDVSTVLGESQTLTGGDVLPGFELPLKQLFARVPKNGKGRAKAKPRKRR
jgi:Uma2 family endonuclease